MNEQNTKEKPKEYFRIKRLIIEGKNDEALQLIEKLKETEEITLHDIILYNLFKCDIIYQQGLWEDLFKFAENVYQESLGLGENILSVDALLKMAEALIWLGDPIRAEEIIKQGENLLKTQTQSPPLEYKQREANLLYVKGLFYAWIKNDADTALEHIDHSITLLKKLGDKTGVIKSLFISVFVLNYLKGEYDQALKLVEQSLTLSKECNYKYFNARGLFLKGMIYQAKGDYDRSIKIWEQSLTEFKELNNKYFIAFINGAMSIAHMMKGDLDKGLEYAELAVTLAKEVNNKLLVANNLDFLANLYILKGDTDRSILLREQSLEIFKSVGQKFGMAMVLNNLAGTYRIIGKLERALECIELSIKLNNELGNLGAVAHNYDFLIEILIDKGELKQAQNAIEHLENMKNQLNDKQINLIYMVNKALLLMTSTRSRDRGKAEEILKLIIEDETTNYETAIVALLNLCELLLTELSMTNDLNVLEEINYYSAQLLEIAEKNHSFILFAEIYFLKAKLALLTLDVKTARRFLTQAQKIAERFGLNQLATKISAEHNNLLEQLSMWENLQKTEISLSERIKLAGLDKHMKETLQKSAIITTQIFEQNVTIHREQKVCLVCKGEIKGYMYVCECDAIYCENCARALTNLENVCWVCNTPLDISKPTKPYKEVKLKEKDIIQKKT